MSEATLSRSPLRSPKIARRRGEIERHLLVEVMERGAAKVELWLDFANQIEIAGSFEPPGCGVVLIDEDSVIVHFHDFLDESTKFSLRQSPV